MGTATYLTAAICSALGRTAATANTWCHESAVTAAATAAATALGLDKLVP